MSNANPFSTNFLPVFIAGAAALVLLIAIVAVVVARRGVVRPQPLVLGAFKDDMDGDWENPIYDGKARAVSFDNPIYDRLDNMV